MINKDLVLDYVYLAETSYFNFSDDILSNNIYNFEKVINTISKKEEGQDLAG